MNKIKSILILIAILGFTAFINTVHISVGFSSLNIKVWLISSLSVYLVAMFMRFIDKRKYKGEVDEI